MDGFSAGAMQRYYSSIDREGGEINYLINACICLIFGCKQCSLISYICMKTAKGRGRKLIWAAHAAAVLECSLISYAYMHEDSEELEDRLFHMHLFF